MTRCVGRDEGEGLWHARNQSDKHMLPHHIMVRNARQADRQKRTNFADCLLIWHIGRKHSISISERLFFLAATLDRKEARLFLRHLRGEQQSFSRSDSYVGVRWSLSPAASNTHNDIFHFTRKSSNYGGWLLFIYIYVVIFATSTTLFPVVGQKSCPETRAVEPPPAPVPKPHTFTAFRHFTMSPFPNIVSPLPEINAENGEIVVGLERKSRQGKSWEKENERVDRDCGIRGMTR